MAVLHGIHTLVYLGAYDLTTMLKEISAPQQYDKADTNCFRPIASGKGKTSIPGAKEATVGFSGYMTDGVSGSHSIMAAVLGQSNQPCSIVYGGETLGNPAVVSYGWVTMYEPTSNVGSANAFAGDVAGQAGGHDYGLLLALGAAVATATNYSSQDNAASSSGGYAANLHVTAVTGSPTGIVFKLQHSADNSTWADLATFTTVTAATSEYKTGTGTVNRYLRAIVSSITGGTSPTVSFIVVAARRP